MKKRMKIVVLFFCVALLLCSCSGNQPKYITLDFNDGGATLEDCPTTEAAILKQENFPFSKWVLYEDGLFCIYGKRLSVSDSNTEDLPWHEERALIKHVYIADGITKIPHFAFKECVNLETVRLPDTLETIGLSAFRDCLNLQEISLPEGLTQIDYWAFSCCNSLKEITIPGTIKHLDNYAFQGCENLERIIISEGVETIGFDVFEDCVNLQSVVFPTSLKEIDVYTFRNCSKLTDIYYMGPQQDVIPISVEPKGNEPLFEATIHFNDEM
ncbi:MAG: leucine-rich repeat domain-containing protein [Clostridia bacterium]|nr:leucine-rich repeat domain-containing protein [Clostridia bacterium]